MRLKNKTAIITGASSGIGRAIAVRFMEEGANVVAVDISTAVVEGGAPVIEVLSAIGPNAIFIQGDVARSEDVSHVFAEAQARFGRLDIVVNNAAIHVPKPLAETEETEWDRVMDVNLKGAFLCSRAAVRIMLQQEIVADKLHLPAIRVDRAPADGIGHVIDRDDVQPTGGLIDVIGLERQAARRNFVDDL